MPANQVIVTVSDLEPLEHDLINLKDISFKVCANLNVVSVSSYEDVKSVTLDMKVLETGCIRVIVMNKEQLYGSICFDSQTDFGTQGQTHKQWVTLFDDTDDDVYDGTLGLDDEEGPRLLIAFHLASLAVSTEFAASTKARQFTKDDDEVEMQSVAPLPAQPSKKPAAILNSTTKPLQAFDVKALKKEEQHDVVSTLFGGKAEPKL